METCRVLIPPPRRFQFFISQLFHLSKLFACATDRFIAFGRVLRCGLHCARNVNEDRNQKTKIRPPWQILIPAHTVWDIVLMMPSFLRCIAHAGSRTRVTSMGGLYDAATLHALVNQVSTAIHF